MLKASLEIMQIKFVFDDNGVQCMFIKSPLACGHYAIRIYCLRSVEFKLQVPIQLYKHSALRICFLSGNCGVYILSCFTPTIFQVQFVA